MVWYRYAIAGFVSLRILTPDFGAMSSRAMALEAEFRKSHHYLKQHAESVAFFGGASREGANISRRLEDCLNQQVWRFSCRVVDACFKLFPRTVFKSTILLPRLGS